MSGTRRMWLASLLLLALLPGVRAEAQECPAGAVNTITSNYGGLAAAGLQGDLTERREICLFVRAQVGDDGTTGSWEDVGRVCDIWSDTQAYDVMFRIGKCGLIVPQFEGVGNFYGAAVPLRVEAVWIHQR